MKLYQATYSGKMAADIFIVAESLAEALQLLNDKYHDAGEPNRIVWLGMVNVDALRVVSTSQRA